MLVLLVLAALVLWFLAALPIGVLVGRSIARTDHDEGGVGSRGLEQAA